MTATSQHPATTPRVGEAGIAAGLHNLLGTVPGGLLAWGLTCACAGAIPLLIRDYQMDDLSPAVLFAWIVHLIVAGIGLWGIAFVVLHVLCLHSLINTEASRRRALAGAFIVQLMASTVASAFLKDDASDAGWIAWIALAAICAVLLPWLARPLFESGKRGSRARRNSVGTESAKVVAKRFLLKGAKVLPFEPRCKRHYDRVEVTRILRAKVGRHFTGPPEAVARCHAGNGGILP